MHKSHHFRERERERKKKLPGYRSNIWSKGEYGKRLLLRMYPSLHRFFLGFKSCKCWHTRLSAGYGPGFAQWARTSVKAILENPRPLVSRLRLLNQNFYSDLVERAQRTQLNPVRIERYSNSFFLVASYIVFDCGCKKFGYFWGRFRCQPPPFSFLQEENTFVRGWKGSEMGEKYEWGDYVRGIDRGCNMWLCCMVNRKRENWICIGIKTLKLIYFSATFKSYKPYLVYWTKDVAYRF